MPVSINVRADTRDVEKAIARISKREVPFAVAKALTRTAVKVVDDESRATRHVFKRPVPFTRKAFKHKKATKQNLTSTVYVLPIQEKYFKFQVFGGLRLPNRRVIPIGIRRSLTRSKGVVSKLANQEDTFQGKPRGHPKAKPGIYKRPSRKKSGRKLGRPPKGARRRKPPSKGKLRILVGYRKKADYRPIFHFHRIARNSALRHIRPNMIRSLQEVRGIS